MSRLRLFFSTLLPAAVLLIASCSGGGSGGTAAEPVSGTPVRNNGATALVTIRLTGTLPRNSAIAGVGFSLRFPASVTAATAGSNVASGVVTTTGIFQESMLLPPVYAASAAGESGELRIILAHSRPSGTTGTGEFATIVLQLPDELLPPANEFSVHTPVVVDLTGTIITGMNITVSSVEKRPAP